MIRLHLNLYFVSIFVISWSLFSPCHADNYGIPEGLLSGNSKPANSSTVLLAAERTRRVDPSNQFNYYEGGWDITNKQYFLSVGFSGIPLVVTGLVWFVIVAISFTFIALLHCCGCCNKSRTDYSRKTYVISLIFILLFLIMTTIGGIFLYTGLEKFQTTAGDMSHILITRASTVVDIVCNVIANLGAAKNIQVASFVLPDDIKGGIEKAESFSNQTYYMRTQALDTARISMELLNAIRLSLIYVGSMMLILAALGFIISILGWKVVVYILFFFGWLLVTDTFMLSGLSLIVRNAMGDTCVAMEEWVQHPRENTAISKILPCMDETTAKRALDITRNTSFQVVNLLNAFLTNVANANFPSDLQAGKDISYNQSGPSMPLLCNPFYANLTDRPCGPLEVNLKGAPTAYQSFQCDISPTGICTSMGRLTPSLYTKILVATNMSDTLHRHGPLLARLVDCSFVVDTFDRIIKDDCPSFKRYTNQIFIGLLLVTVAVMFSVILWLLFVGERQLQITSSKKPKRTLVDVR